MVLQPFRKGHVRVRLLLEPLSIHNQKGDNMEEFIANKDAPEQAGTFVDVPVGAEAQIAPRRANRFELVVTNDSDTVVYLRLGTGAAVNSGIRLNANGGMWTCTTWAGPVFARHAGAAVKRVLIAEV